MANKRNVITTRILNLPAGEINPAIIGKDLAPTGINLVKFVNQYNDMTKTEIGNIIPAKVTVYDDQSFVINLKTPPTAFLIKKAAGIEKGAQKSGHEIVGSITRKDLEKIAQTKLPDLNTTNLTGAMRMIEGTARNMGVSIID